MTHDRLVTMTAASLLPEVATQARPSATLLNLFFAPRCPPCPRPPSLLPPPPLPPACLSTGNCCSNVTERNGTDSVAHGGSEIPEFAKNMLARIEALATKAAYTEYNEATGSSSNPAHHHFASNRSGFANTSNVSKRSNASTSYN